MSIMRRHAADSFTCCKDENEERDFGKLYVTRWLGTAIDALNPGLKTGV